jgi:predicted  nucleic acid-binding Zn-ribbon protein
MSETEPWKMVVRVASRTLALVIICVLLVAALGVTIAYYTLKIDNINADDTETINELNATIANQANTVASLNITNLTTENSQLQAWLNGNETLLYQFEASFNTLQTWLNGNITSYETQISSLKSQIGQLQTWLNGNITSYETQINSLKSQIGQLQTWLNGNITSYETQINSLKSQIGQLQTWLNGNITSYETQINSLKLQIANLEVRAIWGVNNIQFDLDDLEHFTVNVTNAPVSLAEINITKVDFNQNITSINSVVIAPASSSVVVCGFNWTRYVGTSVTVTVHARVFGQNETATSQTLVLPYFKVMNVSFSNFPTGNPYVNITIFNSQYSPINANITQISVTANNLTKLVDGTIAVPNISSSGYLLPIGNEVTFVYPWNWSLYSGQNVTFTVTSAQGSPVSATFKVG